MSLLLDAHCCSLSEEALRKDQQHRHDQEQGEGELELAADCGHQRNHGAFGDTDDEAADDRAEAGLE